MVKVENLYSANYLINLFYAKSDCLFTKYSEVCILKVMLMSLNGKITSILNIDFKHNENQTVIMIFFSTKIFSL